MIDKYCIRRAYGTGYIVSFAPILSQEEKIFLTLREAFEFIEEYLVHKDSSGAPKECVLLNHESQNSNK